MTDLESDIIQYIINVDRAVTVRELSEHLEYQGSDDEVRDVLENLLDEEYVSADLFGDEVRVTRYYPTDKLFIEFK
mgnify:CR=1 FL=1